MNPIETVTLLYDLQRQGIVLWCEDGEKLKYSSREPIPENVFDRIKTNKSDLVTFLVDRKIDKSYVIPRLFSVRASSYPLSPAQERLWFLAQLQENDNYIYNEPITLTFDKQCNVELLAKTLQIMVERHTSLRTLFKKDKDGSPKQIVLPLDDERVQASYQIKPKVMGKQMLSQQLEADKKQVFDLSLQPPINCHLYYLNSSDEFVLSLVQHHIITDGTSVSLFIHEFYTLYNQLLSHEEVELPEITLSYTDYALWFRSFCNKASFEDQLAYWKTHLQGFQTLQLPKRNLQQNKGMRSVIHKYAPDETLVAELKTLAKEHKTTLFVTLLTGFYLLLHRYSSQDDIVVGTPINGRNLPQTQSMLGFFINTLALRAKIHEQRGCDFLREVNQLYLEAMKHQDLPFEMLVDTLGSARSVETTPIFNTMFAYQKFNLHNTEPEEATSVLEDAPAAEAKFDITFDFKETESNLVACIQYNENLFSQETIAQMAKHFINLLQQLVRHPTKPVNQLHILSQEENQNIVHQWNSRRIPYDVDKTINEYFETNAKKTPHKIAVTHAGEQLSYSELNAQANKLANYLRTRYVEYYGAELSPETFIVISLERSLDMVIAILAVMKAGAAYVPVDVDYPAKRKQFIIEDTGAKFILTKPHYSDDFMAVLEHVDMILDVEDGMSSDNLSTENLSQSATANNTLYIIYTSGSTGAPKGVCTSHASVNNFISSVASVMNLDARTFMTVSSFTFDMFCFDFYCSLCRGGTLDLTDVAMVKEPDVLVRYIDDTKPDVIIATPSLWHMINDKLTPSANLTIISAGEALQSNLAEKLFRLSSDVWDAYGPTETTVFSVLKQLIPGEPRAIGKPIPNVTAYILDKYLQPVPVGVVGELYIGGDCLAKGYLNRPELTRERFIQNPFTTNEQRKNNSNQTLYKTGDLVCWLPSGDIKYIGRNDFQVKVSGHRIELEELENVLNKFSKINQCVVVPVKSDISQQLMVYYTAKERIAENTFREYLAQSLPGFMIPNVYLHLDRFPLNKNGKIDLQNLPTLSEMHCDDNNAEPQNATEKQLSEMLADVLNVKPFAVDKNIFDMGCNSLMAVRLQTRINDHFNATLKVVDIFYYPTITELAKRITSAVKITSTKKENIPSPKKAAIQENDDIAIIGYSCAFPMSEDGETFWANLKAGKECISELSRDACLKRHVSMDVLNDARYKPYAGVLPDIDCFDPNFWDVSDDDAQFMDQKMRLLLEQAWKALEHSGYIKERKQLTTGLFIGVGKLDYLDHLLKMEHIKQSTNYFDYSMLNSRDYFINRIAYLLGIAGPLLSVDTACSSSAVAITEGCDKLLAGLCDLAVVGGVNLCSADDFGHIQYDGMALLSEDGHSRIFDKRGGGVVRSDGAGVVVLKRYSEALKDNDTIRAVIKGYGVSHDGMRKMGNMYPRLSSLKQCISQAKQRANRSHLDYVECHGMGFELGELFEFDALRETAELTSPARQCMLGSVKANIGHTGYASGIAQLIKLACMLEDKVIPPQINYANPYPEFNLDREPFEISSEKCAWQATNTAKTAGMT